MNSILVPTDFSQNANDAAHYAAALANITGARLLLFHAYHVSMALDETADLGIDLDLENFENLNQTQIDKLAYTLHKTYGISVTRMMRPGFAVDEIPLIAKRLKADLVVMGMRGRNQAANSSLGRITAAIVQESQVPVLCIPAGLNFTPFGQLSLTYENVAFTSLPETQVRQKLESLFGTFITNIHANHYSEKLDLALSGVATEVTGRRPTYQNYEFGYTGEPALEPVSSIDPAPATNRLVIMSPDRNNLNNNLSAHLINIPEKFLQLPVIVLPANV